MAMNGITTQRSTPAEARRRPPYISALALRVIIAMIISWLIVMAFFVTSVVSH
jgi:hypothetical protein